MISTSIRYSIEKIDDTGTDDKDTTDGNIDDINTDDKDIGDTDIYEKNTDDKDIDDKSTDDNDISDRNIEEKSTDDREIDNNSIDAVESESQNKQASETVDIVSKVEEAEREKSCGGMTPKPKWAEDYSFFIVDAFIRLDLRQVLYTCHTRHIYHWYCKNGWEIRLKSSRIA